MPSVTRRRTNRASKVPDRARDAVEALLAEGASFTELSVEDIAAEAGIARSTFYLHFSDKSQLLVGIAASLLGELVAAVLPLAEADPLAREPVAAAITDLVTVYRRRYPLFAALNEAAAYDPDLAELMTRATAPVVDLVAGQLERLPHLTAGADAHEVAGALIAMIERTCHLRLRDADDATCASVADALTTILWSVAS